MANEAVISLGSNIDPEHNIPLALKHIAEQMQLLKQSGFIYTKPMVYEQQPDILNGSVLVNTDDDYETLRSRLKQIENDLGRVRTALKAGPRSIDLDIVVWNGQIMDPHFYDWDFLQALVLEVRPDLPH